jgi:hypothetical protein
MDFRDGEDGARRVRGLAQFLNSFLNHHQRAGAEKIVFQGRNGEQIDPGLRIKDRQIARVGVSDHEFILTI